MENQPTARIYSILFLLTGIFAILGAMYSWGEGPLLQQTDLICVLIPWGDLLITGPLSLLAAYGLIRERSWGETLGLMVSGIYIFGSILVYICLLWRGAPYPLALALPPMAGILIGVSYPVIKNRPTAVLTLNDSNRSPAEDPLKIPHVKLPAICPAKNLVYEYIPIQEPEN